MIKKVFVVVVLWPKKLHICESSILITQSAWQNTPMRAFVILKRIRLRAYHNTSWFWWCCYSCVVTALAHFPSSFCHESGKRSSWWCQNAVTCASSLFCYRAGLLVVVVCVVVGPQTHNILNRQRGLPFLFLLHLLSVCLFFLSHISFFCWYAENAICMYAWVRRKTKFRLSICDISLYRVTCW